MKQCCLRGVFAFCIVLSFSFAVCGQESTNEIEFVLPSAPKPEEFGMGELEKPLRDKYNIDGSVHVSPEAPDVAGDLARKEEKKAILDDLYFSEAIVQLTEKEQRTLAKHKDWQDGTANLIGPTVGPDGAIEFIHGVEQPSIVCAVLQLTDIEFEPGEKINSINLGDSARWSVEPGVHGGDTLHLFVRPKDVGLETSLVVTTSERTYHIRLRSHRTEYMSHVKFNYVKDANNKLNVIMSDLSAKRERETIPETREYLGSMHFDYKVSGRAAFKPTRVYDDGRKVIIEFANNLQEAPSLMVVRRGGRVLTRSEQEMVVYRGSGENRIVVDKLFEIADLIDGVGRKQQRIRIVRLEKKGG